MSRNICTMTFHRADNYGAILQTYALQKKLQLLGVDSEVLDYRGRGIEKQYRPRSPRESGSMKAYISQRCKNLLLSRRKARFNSFRSKIKLSRPYDESNIHQAADIYDVFIVGSDQVWNYDSSGKDSNYFLSFVSDKKRKYSYAASMGTASITYDRIMTYKNQLMDFNNISVREFSAKRIITDNMGLSCQQNIDPFFLLTARQWGETISTQSKELVKGKFIFVYQLLKSDKMLEFAEKKGKELNCSVVIVSRSLHIRKSMINRSNAGPEEWLWYIANSQMVITNSFHGTAAAITFNKPFYLDYDERANTRTRIDSILDQLSIGNRWINGNGFDEIDYVEVNKRLEEERQASELYLKGICDE